MGKRHLKMLKSLTKPKSLRKKHFNEVLNEEILKTTDVDLTENLLDSAKYLWFKKKNWSYGMPTFLSVLLVCVLLTYQNCTGGGGAGGDGGNTRSVSSNSEAVVLPEFNESCTPRVSYTNSSLRIHCIKENAFLYGAHISINGKLCTNVAIVNKSEFFCDIPSNDIGIYDITVLNTDSNLVILPKAIGYQNSPLSFYGAQIEYGKSARLQATGGIPPYYYYKKGGLGKIEVTGVYTAPELQEGKSEIYVLDSIGQRLDTSVDVVSPSFYGEPRYVTLAPGDQTGFVGKGGLPPYSFRISSGEGIIDSGGVFSLPLDAKVGTTIVSVSDSKGRIYNSYVTISAVAISPTSKTISLNNAISFSVSGGKAPYKFSTDPAMGNFDGQGRFVPIKVGITKVRVSDSLGNYSESSIVINAPFSVINSNVKTVVGSITKTNISGGVPPYKFPVLTIGVFDSNGNFSASKTGQANAQIIDAISNTITVSLEVAPALSASYISPMRIDEQQGIIVSGGFAPYQYNLINSSGGSISQTGTYFPETSTSTSLIQIKDTYGHTLNVNIEKIQPNIATTASLSMPSQGKQSFRVSGTYPPFQVELVNPEAGSFDPQNLAFVSPWNSAPARFKITDSLGFEKLFNIEKVPGGKKVEADKFILLKSGNIIAKVKNPKYGTSSSELVSLEPDGDVSSFYVGGQGQDFFASNADDIYILDGTLLIRRNNSLFDSRQLYPSFSFPSRPVLTGGTGGVFVLGSSSYYAHFKSDLTQMKVSQPFSDFFDSRILFSNFVERDSLGFNYKVLGSGVGSIFQLKINTSDGNFQSSRERLKSNNAHVLCRFSNGDLLAIDNYPLSFVVYDSTYLNEVFRSPPIEVFSTFVGAFRNEQGYQLHSVDTSWEFGYSENLGAPPNKGTPFTWSGFGKSLPIKDRCISYSTSFFESLDGDFYIHMYGGKPPYLIHKFNSVGVEQ